MGRSRITFHLLVRRWGYPTAIALLALLYVLDLVVLVLLIPEKRGAELG